MSRRTFSSDQNYRRQMENDDIVDDLSERDREANARADDEHDERDRWFVKGAYDDPPQPSAQERYDHPESEW